MIYLTREHPNGFTTHYLDPEGYLQIHVWRGVTARGDAHRHAWWLRSFVLVGALGIRTYREVEGPDGGSLIRYEWASRKLVPAGRGGIKLLGSHRVGAGEKHECPLHVFHDVVPLELPTVTLFTHGPREQSAIVYRAADVERITRSAVSEMRNR